MTATGILTLGAGAIRIDLAPARGGGITAFRYGDQPIFADVRGDRPVDMASLPLLPFCNRIAQGRFVAGGRSIVLPATPPEAHALHGHGWLQPWQVVAAGRDSVQLRYDHAADAWPWAYRAEQRLVVDSDGYSHDLSLTNLGDTAMPAGLGLHPWLPRTAETRYHGLHRHQWQTGPDLLPLQRLGDGTLQDWWQGQPVASRIVDCCYAGSDGARLIAWPDRGLALRITGSGLFEYTHVYVPAGADFFCVEPVSHLPDAVNRNGDTGLHWLQPGETLAGQVRFSVSTVSAG